MAYGVTVFHSLAEAVRAGFEICARTPEGYLARINLGGQWQMALVEIRKSGHDPS
ncbi:MAG TPA: hypothetical protein VMF61_10560 [Candidatus Acidoferrales bacterium]|nr:hypothetical protein [Candidatus Acidoferrales bacterium]